MPRSADVRAPTRDWRTPKPPPKPEVHFEEALLGFIEEACSGGAGTSDVSPSWGRPLEIHDTTQGGSLFVAATGTPYPVALQGGKQQGDITFADWDADETIEAPKGAVDLSSLGK